MTYAELEARLAAVARGGMKLGLDRIQRALSELGDPHRAAPVLHVAGTNGKGSICAYLEAACRAAGLRTGLYTSPHLERFTERYRIGGEPIAEAKLVAAYEALQERLPWVFDGDDALTFFELVTLLGFHVFAAERVDVLVAEVGLGGRLDATNVVQPIGCALAPIGLEHREFLGDTLAQIAGEKAAILKRNVPAASARQEPEVRAVFDRAAARASAHLEYEGQEFELAPENGRLVYRSPDGLIDDVRLGLRGTFQHSNAAVAARTLELAAQRGLPVTHEHVARGLAEAAWPGRLETVRRHPEVVLDGAHNPHAAQALARTLPEVFPRRRLHLVVGVLGDKEFAPVLDALVPLAASVFVTTPSSPRARPAAELVPVAARHGVPVERVEPAPEAVRRAMERCEGSDLVLVVGSLHLVGEIRAALRGERAGGPSELLRPAR